MSKFTHNKTRSVGFKSSELLAARYPAVLGVWRSCLYLIQVGYALLGPVQCRSRYEVSFFSLRGEGLAKDDLVNLDGRVSNLSGGGVYLVALENGLEISAKLCGKMKRFKIKVVVGDRVSIGVSPYDPTHGLILHRYKV